MSSSVLVQKVRRAPVGESVMVQWRSVACPIKSAATRASVAPSSRASLNVVTIPPVTHKRPYVGVSRPRSWSHFVGVYLQKLTTSYKNDFEIPQRRALGGIPPHTRMSIFLCPLAPGVVNMRETWKDDKPKRLGYRNPIPGRIGGFRLQFPYKFRGRGIASQIR